MPIISKNELLRATMADNNNLRKKIEELENALKPFAEFAETYDVRRSLQPFEDKDVIYSREFPNKSYEITVGALRAARKALEGK